MASTATPTIYPCTRCKKTYKTKSQLTIHSSVDHSLTAADLQLLKCEWCPYTTYFESTLRKHATMHRDEKRYKCTQCDWAFTQRAWLITHIHLRHTADELARVHKCDTCDKLFKTAWCVTAHQKVHIVSTDENRHRCTATACNKTFKEEHSLSLHVIKFHTMRYDLVCSKCTFQGNSPSDLQRHSVVHSGDRAFECDQCEQAYKSKAHLGRHINVKHVLDSVGRKHKCDICEMWFHSTAQLKLHRIFKHTDERPFQCTIADCSLLFKTKYCVKLHLHHAHNDERPKKFDCQLCQRPFKDQGSLNQHMRSATNCVKPMKCAHCYYRCTTKRTMISHVEAKHVVVDG